MKDEKEIILRREDRLLKNEKIVATCKNWSDLSFYCFSRNCFKFLWG